MTSPKQILNDPEPIEPKLARFLYKKYAPGFLAICIRYCGNRKDGEDALHDGFIKILQNLSKFKEIKGGSFEGWMKRIIINTVLNYIRDHAVEKKFLDIDPLNEIISEADEEENYFERLSGNINAGEVMNMICELPLGYRTVFNMYVFESYSHNEIAEILKCSVNTSKSQLSKARKLLRQKLNKEYDNQFAHNGKAESPSR